MSRRYLAAMLLLAAVAGHRIAEASVQQFGQEVAAGLRGELARPA